MNFKSLYRRVSDGVLCVMRRRPLSEVRQTYIHIQARLQMKQTKERRRKNVPGYSGQVEPLVRLPHGAEHQKGEAKTPMVSDGDVLAMDCSFQVNMVVLNAVQKTAQGLRYISLNGDHQLPLSECQSLAKALEAYQSRVQDILTRRRCDESSSHRRPATTPVQHEGVCSHA